MDYETTQLEGYSVIGLGLDCADGETEGIGPLWEKQFFPRWKELNPTQRIVGLSLPREGGFRYLAAAEMPDDATVPDGMERAAVPAGNYLKVRFVGKPTEMPQAFARIFSELLPASGAKQHDSPVCIEDYPHDCWDEATGTVTCDLYVQLAE